MVRRTARAKQKKRGEDNTVRAILAAVFAVIAAAAQAQTSPENWPTRPVILVVPFPAGGPVDVAARTFAQSGSASSSSSRISVARADGLAPHARQP
jgi:tripartite-type tricarboxylate transporter receptor subunit TctC